MMSKSALKIKVCGMREGNNLRDLAKLNPDYVGLIFYSQSKRFTGALDPSFLECLPPSVKRTGVFVNATTEEIREKIALYHLNAIQLHGAESSAFCKSFSDKPVEVIKAFGIDDQFDFNLLNEYAEAVDFFLFDTKTPQHGGSGLTFNWDLLRNYPLDTPYFLSGGLSLENLSSLETLKDSRLYAIDLNSKFETRPGLKDIAKLTAVFNEIRSQD